MSMNPALPVTNTDVRRYLKIAVDHVVTPEDVTVVSLHN